jgi:4-amino-4-deoxy-L-arabinose transferase-like glycosyltransferase
MISDDANKSTDFLNPVRLLILIVAIHMTLAGWFAFVTPYRQGGALLGQRGPDGGPAIVKDIGAPDERQHANYISHLMSGQGFPIFDPKDPDLYESYQSHQPPLYYLLATSWAKVTGVSEVESHDSGIKLRFLNVLIGAFTIWGVFCLGKWAFADDRSALLGAAVAALLPTQAALDGAISNDPLLICLCTWTLAFGALAMREHWCWGLAPRVALLAGLAILTKTTGVALILALPIMCWLPKQGRPTLAHLGAMAAIMAVLVLPWWFRNQSLYGDPLAMGAFNKAFVGSPQASAFIDGLGAPTYWIQWVGWWTARSFIGVFGYMDIWLTNTGGQSGAVGIYILDLLLIVLAIVGAIATWPSEDTKQRNASILFGLFSTVVLVLFLRFNAQYFQAQARYLMPAIGPIAAVIGFGAPRLWKARPALLPAVLVLSLAFTGLFALTKLPSEFQRRSDLGPHWR